MLVRHNDILVMVKKVNFVIAPMSRMTQEQRDIIGLGDAQRTDKNGFGFMSEYNDGAGELMYRAFIGEDLAKKMSDMAKHYNLKYDRMCCVFLCDVLVLDSLQHANDPNIILSTFNICETLIQQGERPILRELVLSFMTEQKIDGRAIPGQIRQLLNA